MAIRDSDVFYHTAEPKVEPAQGKASTITCSNPWLMGLLGVFRSLYSVEGLKRNCCGTSFFFFPPNAVVVVVLLLL
jgi:hypothetical protein